MTARPLLFAAQCSGTAFSPVDNVRVGREIAMPRRTRGQQRRKRDRQQARLGCMLETWRGRRTHHVVTSQTEWRSTRIHSLHSCGDYSRRAVLYCDVRSPVMAMVLPSYF
jgi:hypothetical protein